MKPLSHQEHKRIYDETGIDVDGIHLYLNPESKMTIGDHKCYIAIGSPLEVLYKGSGTLSIPKCL